MSLWKFNCYLSINGDDEIDEWYDNLPPKAQAKFDKLIEHFRDTPHHQWPSDKFKQLVGYDGIYEMRFLMLNIQYRPLGCFGPELSEYTILIGAIEQGDRFNPRNAPALAEERKETINEDRKRVHECDF